LAGFITIPPDPRSVVPEMVGALVDGEIGARASAAEIRRRGLIAYSEIWRHGGVHMVLVIPDGVARIAYLIPGHAPIYAAVRNNTAAFQINPTPKLPGQAENAATTKWYARDGKLTKRIPSFSSTTKRADLPLQREPVGRAGRPGGRLAVMRLQVRPASSVLSTVSPATSRHTRGVTTLTW
jgi:hypothetical protein